MTATDDLTPRMFAVAKMIDEFRDAYQRRNGERFRAEVTGYELRTLADELRTLADQWDRADAARAAEDAAVEELARELHLASIVSGVANNECDWADLEPHNQAVCRVEARQLITAGYRKGGA